MNDIKWYELGLRLKVQKISLLTNHSLVTRKLCSIQQWRWICVNRELKSCWNKIML